MSSPYQRRQIAKPSSQLARSTCAAIKRRPRSGSGRSYAAAVSASLSAVESSLVATSRTSPLVPLLSSWKWMAVGMRVVFTSMSAVMLNSAKRARTVRIAAALVESNLAAAVALIRSAL